ncbi:MAG: UvrD-helicase domain-containing protein, partial [Holosporales bacterium]|nr:UvrD-helicase domain-containing protein [Holosporales bacterium]
MRSSLYDPSTSLWIEASAGTGKTKILVDRLLALLLSGIPPSKILCITFTKAAALEMQERLEHRLAAWQQDETLRETLQQEGFPEADPIQAHGLFGKVLHTPVRFHTLHSFCQSILERFGSIPQTIIESTDQDLFLERALDTILKNMSTPSTLDAAFRRISPLMDRKTLLDAFKGILHMRTNLEAIAQCSFSQLCAKYAAALEISPETLHQEEKAFFAHKISTDLKERLKTATECLARGTKTEQSYAQGLHIWMKQPPTAKTL